MKKYDLMATINDTIEHSKQLNLTFQSTGYQETYPRDDSRDPFDDRIDNLSSLAHITESYRSYSTNNFLLKWFFGKLRRYLFREIDFRYGLILGNQEKVNLDAIEALKFLRTSISDLQSQLLEKEQQMDVLRSDLQSQLLEKEQQMDVLRSDLQSELKEIQYPSLDMDYFKFENQFRGPEVEICKRLEKYLKYFESCRNVLDVGCGRGEFLDICRNNAILAVGLDMNEQFCEYVKHKGHNVICDDAFHYLMSVEIESLDGVFAAHVLEHLSERDLIRIISLFYEKLTPGSYCVIETPNAESLYGLAHWFYTDLTHKKPLHPLTLEFLFKEQGFSSVEVLRVDYQGFDGMDEVHKMIMAPADFAIIARK